MVTCDISLDDGARDRRLIVEQEAPPGAHGCLHIHTAVAFAAEVDPGTALRRASHLPLGSLGYMAGDGGEDILSFGVRVPFAFLEAADQATVVGVMADLARLADGLERDLAAAGRPDPS